VCPNDRRYCDELCIDTLSQSGFEKDNEFMRLWEMPNLWKVLEIGQIDIRNKVVLKRKDYSPQWKGELSNWI